MSFNAGELVATIRLDGQSKFDADLDRTGQKFQQTSTAAQKAGKVAAGAFKGAAVAITGATVAGGAFVTSLFKTGVAYNQLQQQSRAALKTIMGGAKQANAQMDKLDKFAKTSPFAKQIFITAQQQLISFGRSAKKVIPDMKALQDAVAATGGTGQQLRELTFIFAQIQAAGKITGQDLLQFGQRGVDAATLIGSQMGKTGQEIRQEITAGSLDATKALDALSAGMEQRFGGAAANVKKTFAGTVDNIKAAARDLGAALAEPFVGHKSGGLFIDWGNKAADVVRAVEDKVKQLTPVLEKKLEPAFDGVGDKLDRIKKLIDDVDVDDLVDGLDELADYAPSVGAAAGAVAGLTSASLRGVPIIGNYLGVLNPVAGALIGIATASPEVRKSLLDLLHAFSPLVPVIADLSKSLADDLNAVLPVAAGLIKDVADAVKPVAEEISKIPTPVLTTMAAGAAAAWAAFKLWTGIPAIVTAVRKRVAAARVTVGLLGDSLSRTAKFLTGPWGIAMVGSVVGINLLEKALKSVQSTSSEMTNSIKTAKSAMDIFKTASKGKDLQWWTDVQGTVKDLDHVLDLSAKKWHNYFSVMGDTNLGAAQNVLSDIGKSLGKIAATDLPSAQHGFQLLAAQTNGSQTQLWRLLSLMPDYRDALKEQATQLGINVTSSDEAANKTALLKLAMGEAKSTTDDNSDALAKLSGKAKDADGSISKLAQTIRGFGSGQLDVAQAQSDFQQAIDDATASIQQNGKTLNIATEQGRANDQALRGIVSSTLAVVAAQAQAGASQETLTGSMAAGRKAFIDAATAAGLTADAANKLADKYGLIPKNVGTAIDATDNASPDIQSVSKLLDSIDNKTSTVYIDYYRRLKGSPIQMLPPDLRQENGSVLDFYRRGGLRENHVAQIAPAGAWRVWAEPETGGEGYIPLAPSKRSRSLEIWEEIGRRLKAPGFANGGIAVGANRPTAFANGGITTTSLSPTTPQETGPSMVELSPLDRRLLMDIAESMGVTIPASTFREVNAAEAVNSANRGAS